MEETNDEDVDYLPFVKMLENVKKTKEEIRKKLSKKTNLKAHWLLNQAKKFTIDLNLNMKVDK